jgi:hypothetical protein
MKSLRRAEKSGLPADRPPDFNTSKGEDGLSDGAGRTKSCIACHKLAAMKANAAGVKVRLAVYCRNESLPACSRPRL